ncbi:MAG: dihydroxyacetone kinase subunit DhaL [Acidaminococcaceae bacterium]
MLTMPILKQMLLAAATELKANSIYLSELDSVAGDGDHGITIGRMADAMKVHLGATKAGGIKTLLDELGMLFMGSNGGSAGPLWGTIFAGMADGLTADTQDVDAQEFKQMFAQAKRDFMDISKAQVGDKTMVDALYPAIDAAQETEGTLPVVMQAMAAAANAGAEKTATLVAKFGRAKNIGERSLGTKDPGAVSLALLFSAMATAAK